MKKREVTDHEAAKHLANRHPKSAPIDLTPENAHGDNYGAGPGSAPGANGPPTTGSIAVGGSLGLG